jgi:hypothetical protein
MSVIRSLFRTIWQFKWWWLPPVGIMIILFVLLLVFSDITGESPFEYLIF